MGCSHLRSADLLLRPNLRRGQTHRWRDGLQALWLIVKYRFFDTEYSRTGEGSEASLGKARAYGSWVIERMGLDLDGTLVEIDAGMGNYTRLLLRAQRLVVTEPNPRLAGALGRRYGRSPHVEIVEGDLEGSLARSATRRRLCLLQRPLHCRRSGMLAGGSGGPSRVLAGRLVLLVPAHDVFVLGGGCGRSPTGADSPPRSLRHRLVAGAGLVPSRAIDEFNRLRRRRLEDVGSIGAHQRRGLAGEALLTPRTSSQTPRRRPSQSRVEPLGVGAAQAMRPGITGRVSGSCPT